MKKRNKVLVILSAIFVAIALVFIVLGFAISGADILGWFNSKWAWMIYTVLGTYILIVAIWLVTDWIKSL